MSPARAPTLSRRALLLGSTGGLLASCSIVSQDEGERGAGGSSGGGGFWPFDREPSPVDVAPYQVLPGEVEPACKVAAVRALEAALTWRDGGSGLPAAQQRVLAQGGRDAAAAPLAPLLTDASWSSLRVVYPQYGGLLKDLSAASVMTVCEQILPDSAPGGSSITVDVRLVREQGAWVVTDLLLPQLPAPAPQLTAAARAVLDDDRIVLPDAARRDVESGLIDEAVLGMLPRLAQRWRLHVLVFSSGHPFNVFGTDRQSNHTLGRAVDIWAIDDVPVIDQGRAAWREVMAAAAELGINEIGGPEDLDGVRGRPYFNDLVHEDHLHLGADRP